MAYGAYVKRSRIYRVETEAGEGPFRDDHVTDAKVNAIRKHGHIDGDPFDPPGPWDDIPGWTMAYRADRTKPYFFGFTSLAELTAWFRCAKVRAELNALGCGVSVYEADPANVMVGHWQCAFKRGDQTTRRVDRFPLPV
jgi:hypothetical protein